MSNHGHLTKQIQARISPPSPRRRQPFDGFSKKELWERLRAAEESGAKAYRLAADLAHDAHNAAATVQHKTTSEYRRDIVNLRDAAYKIRDTYPPKGRS